MTITVKSGGITVNFPDGTDAETINRAMEQATGAKAAPPMGESAPKEIGFDFSERGIGQQALDAINPLKTQAEKVRGSLSWVESGLEELKRDTGGDLLDSAKATASGLGQMALGGAGYLYSPIDTAIRMGVGNPIEAASRLAGRAVGSDKYIPREWPEFAAGLMTPVPRLNMPAKPVARSATELKQSANAEYDAIRASGPLGSTQEADALRARMEAAAAAKKSKWADPETFSTIGNVTNDPIGLLDARELLRGGKASPAAAEARKELESYIGGYAPGLKQADAEYAAYQGSKRITKILDEASRAKDVNALPNTIRKTLNSAKESRYLDDTTKEALEGITKGGGGPRGTINRIAEAANSLPGVVSSVVATGGYSGFAHVGLKVFADRGHIKTLEKLDETIRLKPDLGKQLNGPLTAYGKAVLEVNTDPSTQTMTRLLLASRNLSNNLKDADIDMSPYELVKMIGEGNGVESR